MTSREQPIRIDAGARSIDGTLVIPGDRVPGILFVHGWGGSQQQYLARAREIATLGCVCLAFDLTGHAATQSERESVSREINLQDTVAAYDRLCAHGLVDPEAIAVVGSSYGGYLASILTTMRPVRWLALRAPALYRDVGWSSPKLQLHKEQDLAAYRRTHVLATENRALQACADFGGDVLLVESEHDDIVPHAAIANYRAACVKARSLTHRCVAGADHGLSDEAAQRAYTRLLVEWLAEMLPHSRKREGVQAHAAEDAVPESAPHVLPATAA